MTTTDSDTPFILGEFENSTRLYLSRILLNIDSAVPSLTTSPRHQGAVPWMAASGTCVLGLPVTEALHQAKLLCRTVAT